MGVSFWLRLAAWAQGKKTYILAMIVVLTVLVLEFFGKLTPELGLTILLMALSFFAVTFRSALRAHSDQVLQLLASISALGIAARQHNKDAELAAATATAEQGASLGVEIAQEQKS